LQQLAHSVCLYAHTPLDQALAVPISVAQDFFQSKTFEQWKTAKETEMKLLAASVNGHNHVVQAIAGLARLLARR